jgi:hypothetical protein
MDHERYQDLMWRGKGDLSEDEIKEGWHWCRDWDGLLVGPGMFETSAQPYKDVSRKDMDRSGLPIVSTLGR